MHAEIKGELLESELFF
jgi:hypothetical protein